MPTCNGVHRERERAGVVAKKETLSTYFWMFNPMLITMLAPAEMVMPSSVGDIAVNNSFDDIPLFFCPSYPLFEIFPSTPFLLEPSIFLQVPAVMPHFHTLAVCKSNIKVNDCLELRWCEQPGVQLLNLFFFFQNIYSSQNGAERCRRC